MANTKIVLNVPPKLAWIIPYYQKKAEIRAKLGSKGGIEQEFLNALEQFAIQGLQSEPLFDKLVEISSTARSLNEFTREQMQQRCDDAKFHDDL